MEDMIISLKGMITWKAGEVGKQARGIVVALVQTRLSWSHPRPGEKTGRRQKEKWTAGGKSEEKEREEDRKIGYEWEKGRYKVGKDKKKVMERDHIEK